MRDKLALTIPCVSISEVSEEYSSPPSRLDADVPFTELGTGRVEPLYRFLEGEGGRWNHQSQRMTSYHTSVVRQRVITSRLADQCTYYKALYACLIVHSLLKTHCILLHYIPCLFMF